MRICGIYKISGIRDIFRATRFKDSTSTTLEIGKTYLIQTDTNFIIGQYKGAMVRGSVPHFTPDIHYFTPDIHYLRFTPDIQGCLGFNVNERYLYAYSLTVNRPDAYFQITPHSLYRDLSKLDLEKIIKIIRESELPF